MYRGGFLAVVLLFAALAGCVAGNQDAGEGAAERVGATSTPTPGAWSTGSASPLPVGTVLTPAAEQLWHAPQSAPHPAFNFPTFTTVPENAPAFWQAIPARAWDTDDLSLQHLAEDDGTADYGAGLGVFGQIVVVPQRGGGEIMVYDISDPAEPKLVSSMASSARDTDFIAFPNGRLIAVFASDTDVVPVWDLTDPEYPVHLIDIQPRAGSHNVAVVPGTPILYNANEGAESDIGGLDVGWTEIFDLSDPENPKQIAEFDTGYACHDISFHIDRASEKYRAYCAGIEVTQIWDIEDPRNPEVISTIPFPTGRSEQPAVARFEVSFSHQALANDDASVLVVGDEVLMGIGNTCTAYLETEAKALSGPLGALWFYDISDEQNPELLSWLSPGTHAATTAEGLAGGTQPSLRAEGCTAHMGRMVPHEDRDLLTFGYYRAGVLLVDFTDATDPRIVGQWQEAGNGAFDAWYYQGYIFVGDQFNGLQVLTIGSG